MTRRPQNVDAAVRVTRVAEELLVLGEPLVHGVPLQRDVAGEEARGLGGAFDLPGRLGDAARADAHVEVGGQPLAALLLAPLRRDEQIAAHVVGGEPVDGQPARLVQQHRAARVHDGLALEQRPDAGGHRLEVEQRVGERQRRVEAACRLRAERPRPHGQRHGATLPAATSRARRPVEAGLARRSLRRAAAAADHSGHGLRDPARRRRPRLPGLRVPRALAREGDLGVSRFTYWYTGRPPVHEAILARPVREAR